LGGGGSGASAGATAAGERGDRVVTSSLAERKRNCVTLRRRGMRRFEEQDAASRKQTRHRQATHGVGECVSRAGAVVSRSNGERDRIRERLLQR
jgi:hypothetical protein